MSLNNHEITVIIPAYNEEETISNTLNALNSVQEIDCILVIDDGSNDNTSEIAKSHSANVFRFESNQGKAYAMKKGYEISKTSVIVFLDADIGDSAVEVIKLFKPICYDEADVSIAVFGMASGKGGFGFVKKLANWGLRLLTGKSYKTVLSGQRAFKRSVLSDDCFSYKGFGIEFGMTVDLIKSGACIVEIKVDMRHRTTGRNLKGFLHRGKQFKDISTVIISKLAQKRIIEAKQ